MSEQPAELIAADFSPLPGEQAELFGPGQIPEQPELVRACKEYLHTGKIIMRDRVRCEAVMSAILAGVPITTVMRTFGIGYSSVRRIEADMEAAGKLETLKQRVQRQLLQSGALANEHLIGRLVDGKLPDNVAAVFLGISLQRAAEMGSGDIEPDQKGDLAGDPDDWARRFQEARRVVEAAPIDVQTTEEDSKTQ